MTWNDTRFWPVFRRNGMLDAAQVLYARESEPVTLGADGQPLMVGFEEPDSQEFAGTQSKQYVIEYQHVDLPYLTEGDQVVIKGFIYRVRESPIVDGLVGGGGANGTFRKVLLTRIGPCPA